MKLVNIFYYVISVVVIVVAGLEIFDSMISIKYETEAYDLLSQCYKSKIMWIIYFISYIILSLFLFLFNQKRGALKK
jgi:hypothetical protein